MQPFSRPKPAPKANMFLSESSSLSRTGAGDEGYNSTCPCSLSLFHPPSFKGSLVLGCSSSLVRQENSPLAHGLLVHLSTFFSQLEPVKLGGHSQT